MARAIWKGAISFGLVTIPVEVLPATSSTEKIKFRMLRKEDLSPIKYQRVAEVDGKEVPWDHIVKGYEYEKGQFVVFEDKDFDAVELESVDSIAIQEFVDLADIDPIFFDKPYYLEPAKGGAGAYALLRDVLEETGKVGIAKVAMRGRQHLAALKPSGTLLVLELMHFATEIRPADEIKAPQSNLGSREKEMAKTLVEQMSGEWKPDRYTDEYAEAVMKLIEKKVAAGGKALPGVKKHAPTATNVVDLVAVLQQSLKQSEKGPRAPKHQPPTRAHGKKRPTTAKRASHKKAA
jgi:DNA end-binding protein Ku